MVGLVDIGQAVDVVYLDFSRALNMVSPCYPCSPAGEIQICQVDCKVAGKLAGPLASKGGDQQYKVPVAADC